MPSNPPGPLDALLVVQELDTDLDRARHRRATLPERAQRAALDARIAGLEAQQAAAEAERDAAAGAQEALEQALAGVERHAREVKKRLYGGTVSATRELQALAAELDSLSSRAADLESQALEALEAVDPLEARVAEIEAGKGALIVQRSGVDERLAALEAEVDAEIGRLNAARAEAALGLSAELAATYERLRRQLGGVGAARLVGTHCDGCHLILPATELDRLRRQAPGSLAFCDQCGRILVAG